MVQGRRAADAGMRDARLSRALLARWTSVTALADEALAGDIRTRPFDSTRFEITDGTLIRATWLRRWKPPFRKETG